MNFSLYTHFVIVFDMKLWYVCTVPSVKIIAEITNIQYYKAFFHKLFPFFLHNEYYLG